MGDKITFWPLKRYLSELILIRSSDYYIKQKGHLLSLQIILNLDGISNINILGFLLQIQKTALYSEEI